MKLFNTFFVFFALFVGLLPLEAQNKFSDRQARAEARADARMMRAQARAEARSSRYRSYSHSRSYYGFGYGVRYNSFGWGGGYGRYYMPTTGIRFNMDLIDKKDRDVVEKGIVVIDGAEVGIVDRFNSWHNGSVPVATGTHKILVLLKDGREFETEVVVQPGQIMPVYVRFQ